MSKKKANEWAAEAVGEVSPQVEAVVLPKGFDVAVDLADGDLIQVRGIDCYYQDGSVVCRAKDVALVMGELDRQRTN